MNGVTSIYSSDPNKTNDQVIDPLLAYLDYNFTFPESGELLPESSGKQAFERIKFLAYTICIPIVFAFGIVGNAVSVAVLRRKRLRHTFDEVEQSATSGLVCLALSDIAFCVIGLLPVIMPAKASLFVKNPNAWAVVAIYYNNYKGPLLNIFLLTST